MSVDLVVDQDVCSLRVFLEDCVQDIVHDIFDGQMYYSEEVVQNPPSQMSIVTQYHRTCIVLYTVPLGPWTSLIGQVQEKMDSTARHTNNCRMVRHPMEPADGRLIRIQSCLFGQMHPGTLVSA